jgi:RNA polymerase sigma factor (sigma-70 family)
LAAVPSIGRAARVEGGLAPEADLTRALYEQYANQIFRYCLHQLGSREEAEDAVQSTFLNAFRGIKRGVVPELESAWLFKIAHNVCLSRRRTTWRRGRVESPTDFDVVEELAPAPSRRADELIGLQDVLEQLPENQRRAILLREWQGLSYREIAEELELSQAAVETLIFRARRALASGLEQPPERKRRVVRGTDLGNLLAGLKSLLLGGGAAVKVAATVAVVSASTVVVAAPVVQYRAQSHRPQSLAVKSSTSSKPAAQAGSQAVVLQAGSIAGPEAAFPGRHRGLSSGQRLVQRLFAPEGAAPPVTATSAADGSTVDAPSAPAPATPAADSAPAVDSAPASAPAATPAATAPAPAEPQHVQPAPATSADKSAPSGQSATTVASPSSKATDSKATDTKSTSTDSQQPASSSSGGSTATTQPVVAPPTTAPTPIVQTKTTTQTIQAPAVIPMAPSTATQYLGTQSSSSQSSGQSGSAQSSTKPVVTTPPVASAPVVAAPVVSPPAVVTTPAAPSAPVTRAPVVAPPTTTTQPAPVVSSPTISLSSGSTSIGKPRDISGKGGGNS